MGEIYQAVRLGAAGFRKPVALKRLTAARALDGSAQRRFFREARISARLEHRHIVRVYDLLELEGEHFLVMELLQGHSVAALSKALPREAFSGAVALVIAEQALEGLAYAHALTDEQGRAVGLVHRDLVPGNLFVCLDGCLKILDFGIAKLLLAAPNSFTLGGESTQQGIVHGTLEFLSPEQARGEPVDARSDIYQLGASLYFLLSGRAPHGDAAPVAPVDGPGWESPIALSKLRPDLNANVIALVERAMRPRREDRFDDAAAMLAVVRALLPACPEATPDALAPLPAMAGSLPEGARPATGPTRKLAPSAPSVASQPEAGTSTLTEAFPPRSYPTADLTPTGGPPPIGGRLGRYVLLEQLGEGGMGIVYAAYDPELDRKVALKLMRARRSESLSASEGQARLLREAQAMAKVSHPNVMAVFDVGIYEDRVFLAMELVEGTTMLRWLETTRRPWREVLTRFIDAGRGLAAAHAAGLAHRDFKPANILLGVDGRVRVTDFGLARPASTAITAEQAAAALEQPANVETFGSLLNTPLTQIGAVVGTPGYMAPEQYRGAMPDVRTDQFSFAVALYEGLYGQRPFDATAMAAAVQEGRTLALHEPPAAARVPAWLWRIVRRGLAANPEERHPSLEAMLEALALDPRAAWRRRLTFAALAVTVAAGGFGYYRASSQTGRMCRGAEGRLTGVWDQGVRQAIQRSFAATGKPYAAATFERVARTLDGYTTEWAAMSREACEATRVHGNQSDEVLSLRNVCLERRLSDLKGLVELFTQADVAVLDRAAQAAYGLPSIKGCADVAALKSQVRLPEDPAVRARIRDVTAELGRAKALEFAGKYPQALPIDRKAVASAQAIGYRPLLAEAYLRAGIAEYMGGDLKSGEKTLYESVFVAESAGDLRVQATANAVLITVVGYLQGRSDEARMLDRHAQAALTQLGGDDEIDARRQNNIANIEYAHANFDAAARGYLRAHELTVRSMGPQHQLALLSLNNYADALQNLGRTEETRKILGELVATEERLLGPEHPELAFPLDTLANELMTQGRYDEAQQMAERALGIRESALGPDHPYTADSLQTMGAVLSSRGQEDRGIKMLERAVQIKEKAQGPDHPYLAEALEHLGSALVNAHHSAEALPRFQRALAIREKTQADSPGLAVSLCGIAEVQLSRGAPQQALPLLERAMKLVDGKKEQVNPQIVAETSFALARALASLGREPARARSLAERSRDGLTRLGYHPDLARVESWLAAHPAH
jgi:serine/threonine protein kinase/tetratricopeptide (TPR) repeat protein